MKNDNLKIILTDLAEAAAPTAEINLWPALQSQINASEWNFEEGKRIMQTPFTHTQIFRRAVLVLMAIALAFVILLATPQGRAWAQSILKLFTRAETDVLPLQPWQLTPLPTLSPENTPDAPFALTVDEAETLAGFKVSVPTNTKSHNLFGAEYHPETKSVSINYSDPDIGFGNGLLITEQILASPKDIIPLQGVVGASAPVETVKIGDLSGEYVMGVWNLTDNGPVWIADPSLQTLRWKTDRMFIEIVYMGSRLTKEDLIEIADSMK